VLCKNGRTAVVLIRSLSQGGDEALKTRMRSNVKEEGRENS